MARALPLNLLTCHPGHRAGWDPFYRIRRNGFYGAPSALVRDDEIARCVIVLGKQLASYLK